MIDSPIITAAATKLIDELQLENDRLKNSMKALEVYFSDSETGQQIKILEKLYEECSHDAELFRHMKTMPASELSMLCFEYTQGSGTLDDLVKISRNNLTLRLMLL